MAIVTADISRAKRVRCKGKLFAEMRWLKRHAHRAYRRSAKQAIQAGREVNEKPRLTGWDVV